MSVLSTLALVAVAVAVAGLISARLGIAAALVELVAGVGIGGLTMADPGEPWLATLAAVGGVALTFLAGTGIDARELLSRRPYARLLGLASFTAAFVVVFGAARLLLDWPTVASLVAATVLAETSLAVTYAVLLDLGMVGTWLGRYLVAAVFVTDVAAGLVFTAVMRTPATDLLWFVLGSVAIIACLPRLLSWVADRYGQSSAQPGLRLVVAALALLLALAASTHGIAVLPAFVLGVVAARHYREHPGELVGLRTIVIAFLAPFFFVRVGMNVSVSVLLASTGAVLVLAAAKVLPKLAASYAAARTVVGREAVPVALLMSTGLTFGTVIALAALGEGLVDRSQYTVLVAAILIAAVIPSAIAQRSWRRKPAASELGPMAGVLSSPQSTPSHGQHQQAARS